MSRAVRDAIVFTLFGAVLGAFAATVVASAVVTLIGGGRIDDVGMFDILAYAPPNWPWDWSGMSRTFELALLGAGGGALVGAVGLAALGHRPQLTSHGAARWATADELKRRGFAVPLAKLSGPIFAKLGSPRSNAPFVTSADIPHAFVAAPTGSGKGVGVVIPTLLTYGGSVICLDVKGENFTATSRARAAIGDRVFKFAPYDDEGRTHRFNPLAEVAALPPERRYTEAQRIAESLIAMGGENVQGFLVSAKQIFAAGILAAVERGTPTIGAVHDLLSGEGEFADMFGELAEKTNVAEAKSIFRRMAGTADRTLSAYMSVLFDGGLGAWRDTYVRSATDASDFDLTEFRRTPTTLYIVVGPNDLKVLAPVVRLLFQQTVATLQRAEPGPDEPYPVLLLLDEFPSLGRMQTLSDAITTVRSYGGRMLIIAQSLANLKLAYGADGAQNFLANCRLQLFMAPADADTPEYVSRSIGDFTRKSRSKSWTMGQLTGASVQEREEGARLLRPEAMRALGDEDCVLLVQDCPPVRARKVFYYRDRELRKLVEEQAGALPEPPVTFCVRCAAAASASAAPAMGSQGEGATTEVPGSIETDPKLQEPALKRSDAPIEVAAPVEPARDEPKAVGPGEDDRDDDREVEDLNDAHLALLARIQKVREQSSAS